MSETYLITGANRGIGKALLEAYLIRPNNTVIAAVRDVETSKKQLASVPTGQGSKLIIIKIDSSSQTDPADAVEELKTKYGIESIDVVVSNAGVMPTKAIVPVLKTEADWVRECFEVNTIGPLLLIQAFYPFLMKTAKPRFLAITSRIGSIGSLQQSNVPFFAYGLSKAAANYMMAKLSREHKDLISVAYNPGWVQTELGSSAAQAVGLADAPVALEDSVRGLVKQFDSVTLEQSGGFFTQDGATIPW
jgi:norsolorinic acid ketoreductase